MTREECLHDLAEEINKYSAEMLSSAIEIGRRMTEAKAIVEYGKFGIWIKENTGYSRSMAENFMKLYREYGAGNGSVKECKMTGKLSVSKALELLRLPESEREEFAEKVDAGNITVKELKRKVDEQVGKLSLEETETEKFRRYYVSAVGQIEKMLEIRKNVSGVDRERLNDAIRALSNRLKEEA